MQPSGPPRTVLPPESPSIIAALNAAVGADVEERHDLVAKVVMANPRSLHAWAALGDLGRDDIERYAAYRVETGGGPDAIRGIPLDVVASRSEERRVGKEGRGRGSPYR